MAQFIVLTALYPEMEEATIGRWLVAEGAEVTADQPLAELITDKVVYEYRGEVAGSLIAILLPEKSVAPVGTTLAVIGAPGETVEHLGALLEENRRLAAAREAALADILQATAASAPVPLRRRSAAPCAPRPPRAGSPASVGSISPPCAAAGPRG